MNKISKVVIAVHDLGNLGGIQSAMDGLAEEMASRGIRIEYISMNPQTGPVRVGGPVFVVNRGLSWTMDHPLAASYPGPFGVKLVVKGLLTRPWRVLRRHRLATRLRSYDRHTAVLFAEPEIPDVLLAAGKSLHRDSANRALFVSQIHTSFEGASAWQLEGVLARVIRGTDVFVALSPGDAERFSTRYGGSVAAIGNIVRPARHFVAGSIPPIAIFVGRLAHEKRLDFMIRAFDLAADAVPLWELHIHGDGVLGDELRSLAASARNADRIRFHGLSRNPERLYEGASLAVLTSSFEGQPMLLLEAAANGVPSVARVTSPGVAALVSESGLGVPAVASETEFADALVVAMTDDLWRSTAGRSAVDLARRHAPAVIGDEWLALFDACNSRALRDFSLPGSGSKGTT